ncbi:hypothetical protein ABMC88_10220 [Sulfitobacter sp. HNIBRBA2951]
MDEFKQDAVAQGVERGYAVSEAVRVAPSIQFDANALHWLRRLLP